LFFLGELYFKVIRLRCVTHLAVIILRIITHTNNNNSIAKLASIGDNTSSHPQFITPVSFNVMNTIVSICENHPKMLIVILFFIIKRGLTY
jgi:hypothetical protein